MKLSLGLTPRDYQVFGSVTYDADALAYFNANTAITSDADKNAINTFYLGLKTDGVYSKINAMYLPIWGSAATCKWNLVNPLDTDAAFRLTFATGMTFTSSGMTPNGTSAFADTFLIPSTQLTANSAHLSYYSRTNANTTANDIGSWEGNGLHYTILSLRQSNNLNRSASFIQCTTGAASFIDGNSLGFYIGSRIANNSTVIFKNGVSSGSVTNVFTGQSTRKIYICVANGNSFFYSTKQCAFSSIGSGLTSTDATNFYNRVNTLMTYFGINV
jgi:hypothetical protein